nr:Holliday junction branch migration DNA helicase RuvB [uncultured Halomonas sp.]
MSETVEEVIEDDIVSLRPVTFDNYIGQEKMKRRLSISIDASRKKGSPLDHLLFYGPPGLGKTTIANIIANEMGVSIKSQSAPSIEKVRDLVTLLVTLQENDILFIDEIHRMNTYIEETLYSAMEDFFIEIIAELENEKKPIRINLPKFTLIGATTKPGSISSPLRDRFGMQEKLEFYTINELSIIVHQYAEKLDFDISNIACDEIAKRARGTPRIAIKNLKRLHDYYLSVGFDLESKKEITDAIIFMTGVTEEGFYEKDIEYLTLLAKNGPMGIKNISSMLSEDPSNIEDFIEPHLLQAGLIMKSSRGRHLTDDGILLCKEKKIIID